MESFTREEFSKSEMFEYIYGVDEEDIAYELKLVKKYKNYI